MNVNVPNEYKKEYDSFINRKVNFLTNTKCFYETILEDESIFSYLDSIRWDVEEYCSASNISHTFEIENVKLESVNENYDYYRGSYDGPKEAEIYYEFDVESDNEKQKRIESERLIANKEWEEIKLPKLIERDRKKQLREESMKKIEYEKAYEVVRKDKELFEKLKKEFGD